MTEKKDNTFDKDKAIFDPTSVFSSPMEIVILDEALLSKKDKYQALSTWELECHLQEIGDIENMPILKGKKKLKITTEDVHKAREALGDNKSAERAETTMIGMPAESETKNKPR